MNLTCALEYERWKSLHYSSNKTDSKNQNFYSLMSLRLYANILFPSHRSFFLLSNEDIRWLGRLWFSEVFLQWWKAAEVVHINSSSNVQNSIIWAANSPCSLSEIQKSISSTTLLFHTWPLGNFLLSAHLKGIFFSMLSKYWMRLTQPQDTYMLFTLQ